MTENTLKDFNFIERQNIKNVILKIIFKMLTVTKLIHSFPEQV